MSLHPIAGIVLLLGLLGCLFASLRFYQRQYHPHPELVRKLMHIGTGLVALTLPWLFSTPWPVVTLAALSVGAMLVVRHVQLARDAVGDVVHGVDRKSEGEVYFPIAVASLFYLAQGKPVLYVVPILLLTVADALAALIGVRYGTRKFTTFDGTKKSFEGSAAFFVVAFLATHVVVLLGSDVGRAESVLIGLQMGALIMLVEAVAWRGLDNLFVPLFAYAVLHDSLDLGAAQLGMRLALLIGLWLVVSAWRRETALDSSGLIMGILILYATGVLGGLRWLVTPLLAFSAYALLWPRNGAAADGIATPTPRPYNLDAVLAVNGPGLFWLLMHARLPQLGLLYAFVLAYAIELALIGRATPPKTPGVETWRQNTRAVSVLAWALVFLPFPFLSGLTGRSLLLALVGLPIVLAGVAAFSYAWKTLQFERLSTRRWIVQAAIGALGSFIGLVVAQTLSGPD